MLDKERFAWLRLARTENVGPVTFAALIARFGSAMAALDAVPTLAARGSRSGSGKREFAIPPDAEIAREFAGLAKIGGHFLFSCEPDFPQGLAALDPPPPAIAVLGHAHLLRADMIAMVGARNASALGRKLAWMMARELGEAGLAIERLPHISLLVRRHEGNMTRGKSIVELNGLRVLKKLLDRQRGQ